MRGTRNELNNMTRIWTSESVSIRDIKTKMIQYILFAIQKNGTTHRLNHCFEKKKKISSKKRDNHLERLGGGRQEVTHSIQQLVA